jgi:hypothetical protein
MKFSPTAWWRMRISPAAGVADLHVHQFHLFGTAVLADLDRFAHVRLLVLWLGMPRIVP